MIPTEMTFTISAIEGGIEFWLNSQVLKNGVYVKKVSFMGDDNVFKVKLDAPIITDVPDTKTITKLVDGGEPVHTQEAQEPDIYAGYVIREDGNDYIGPDSERYRVALREHAARFTMTEAKKHVELAQSFKPNRTYRIEPA